MNVIIYGLGGLRIKVEKLLKKEHEIVGYSDSSFQGERFNGRDFYKPKELLKIEFDFIIIAIGDKRTIKIVSEGLVNYQIKKEKIIEFFISYYYNCNNNNYLNYYHYTILESNTSIPLKKLDRVMKNTDKDLDGLILGLSHSAVGINPKYLSKSFYNFSICAQDLYYNLRQLEELSRNYKERIKNLKYVILDMHTYTYFNYDTSLSKNAIGYYRISGFRDNDSHNFRYNRNFTKSIEDELILVQEDDNAVYYDLFETNFIQANERLKAMNEMCSDFPSKYWGSSSLEDEKIEVYKKQPIVASSIQKYIFKNTVQENIEIFEKILKNLKEINSDIKIYIVLIPHHKVIEDRLKIIEKEWKERFYKILNNFEQKYKFEILDFKNTEEVSSRNDYYDNDLIHLNYKGATAFTKLLNSHIFIETKAN